MNANIKAMNRYIRISSLLGEEIFKFKCKPDTDEVLIIKYIPDNSINRVIDIPSFVTGCKEYLFAGVKQNLKVIHKNNQIKNMSKIFSSYYGKRLDLTEFNTDGVEDITEMFKNCSYLEELNIKGFNTKQVKRVTRLFANDYKLKDIDISSFETSKITDMCGMFYSCEKLERLDLSHFNTSNVCDMSYMFSGCTSISDLKIDKFDTSNVIDMTEMFYHCSKLDYLKFKKFNVKNLVKSNYIFYGCYKLRNKDELLSRIEQTKKWKEYLKDKEK